MYAWSQCNLQKLHEPISRVDHLIQKPPGVYVHAESKVWCTQKEMPCLVTSRPIHLPSLTADSVTQLAGWTGPRGAGAWVT